MHPKPLALAAWLLLGGTLLSLSGCNSADAVMEKGDMGAPPGTGFMIKMVQNEGRERRYSLFIPHDYTPQKAWPVIVFLHGIGEGGTGAEHNLTVGLAPVVAERAATFPFIVVFPQSASGHWDADSNAAADAIAALDQVERDYSVDHERVFLTGVSTGGYGTWAIGAKYKDHFTGLVPMCAFTDFKDVDKLIDMPIWCFHNAGDPFVLAGGSQSMCDQINDRGGHAKFTEYFAIGHDVWVRAYQKDDLYEWMLNTRQNPLTRSSTSRTLTASAQSTPAASPTSPAIATRAAQPRDTAADADPKPMTQAVPARPVANNQPSSNTYVPMVW